MNRLLVFEQEVSLVERLVAAGIEHGDTAELEIVGLGVRPSQFGVPSVAFCPSTLTNVRILRKGTSEERAKPIPALVEVSRNLERRILGVAPSNGFIRVQALVYSNGHIQINGRVIDSEPVASNLCVWGTDSYLNYQDLCATQ